MSIQSESYDFEELKYRTNHELRREICDMAGVDHEGRFLTYGNPRALRKKQLTAVAELLQPADDETELGELTLREMQQKTVGWVGGEFEQGHTRTMIDRENLKLIHRALAENTSREHVL